MHCRAHSTDVSLLCIAEECIFPVSTITSCLFVRGTRDDHAVANLFTREKRGVDFKWGSEKIRGVNIGGWLVLEP
jgi:hypothetical protein